MRLVSFWFWWQNKKCSIFKLTFGKFILYWYGTLSLKVTVTGTSDKIRGVITDANHFRSTSDSDTLRLEALLTFENPIQITDETRGMAVKFNLTNGMLLEQRSSKLQLGCGPFFMLLKTE